MILLGRLGKDAETAYTASQTAVTKFSIATSRNIKNQQTGEWKEDTTWTNIVLWNGENVAQYLTKGKQVYIEGRLQTRSYDDKDGKKVWITEVVADGRDLVLVGGGRDAEGGGAPASSEEYGEPMRSAPRARQASAPSAPPPSNDNIGDDDVPF